MNSGHVAFVFRIGIGDSRRLLKTTLEDGLPSGRIVWDVIGWQGWPLPLTCMIFGSTIVSISSDSVSIRRQCLSTALGHSNIIDGFGGGVRPRLAMVYALISCLLDGRRWTLDTMFCSRSRWKHADYSILYVIKRR